MPIPRPVLPVARAIANAKSTTTRTDAGATDERSGSSPFLIPYQSIQRRRRQHARVGTLKRTIGSVVESTGSVPSHDLEHYRQLLDNPNLRRSFLIRSGRDGKGEQQVASVVERTTRYGFFKITVSQGIVIDPRHPEEATVFTLLVNPKELDHLRDQLKVAFSDLVEETPVDPGIVTQLADIGQVQALHPAPLADVSIPREDLALRTKVAGDTENTGPPDLVQETNRARSTDDRTRAKRASAGTRPARLELRSPIPTRSRTSAPEPSRIRPGSGC